MSFSMGLLVSNGCFVREEWRFMFGCVFSFLGSLGLLWYILGLFGENIWTFVC